MEFEEIAKRFRMAMENAGITSAELSRRSGVNKASISHYQNGSHCPHNDNAYKIAQVLDVNPVWLMGFNVPMKKETEWKKNDASLIARITKSEHLPIFEKFLELPEEDKKTVIDMVNYLTTKNKG